MKKAVLLVVLALLLGVMGCVPAAPVAQGQVLQSNKPRISTPVVPTADIQALVDGNNAFALELYQVLKDKGGNLFYSPYSISEALVMTYAGAMGTTESAMADALNLTLPQSRLHPAFNSLDLQLKQRGQGAMGKDEQPFRLHIVNAIWGQKNFTFLPSYLDVLAQNYGAGLRILDFIAQPEQSRTTINDWVSEQTEQKIKDLIPQGAINELTRLVLTNAVYFDASWEVQFDPKVTQNGPFSLLNGGTVTVPMMRQTTTYKYTEGANYQVVELPYDGQELSMVVLLPRAGQFDAFEKALDAQVLKDIVGKLQQAQVVLAMPRFQYESSFGLKQALTTLGMGVAFTENADLSGMDGKRDLLIQDVVHKAFVAVDETGTEAAAATAVIVGTTSVPAQTFEVKIDRPFIFLIRDIATGSTIFIGRVVDPTAK